MATAPVAVAPPAPTRPTMVENYGASEDAAYGRGRFPPKYPPLAKRRGMEGKVMLKVLIGLDGRPVDIKIHKSSRHKILDKAAIAAVKKWKFKPAKKNGKAVQDWVLVPINFSLQNI